MITAKVETTVQTDGELHLTHLPCRKGDRVEAIVLIHRGAGEGSEEETTREEARRRFLAQARASTFRSDGPYPSRDELYDRHLTRPFGSSRVQ
jgi:hypothetical protein